MTPSETPAAPASAIGPWEFFWRIAWLAIQLSLVYCLGERGALFFYQGF
jgi:hypothetical protein